MALHVGWALIFSPILLLFFAWANAASKYSSYFLGLMYSSFVFLGFATLLLLFSDVEHASKGVRRIFYAVAAIAILVTVGVAFSIASLPPGGTSHSIYFTPENAEINLKYGWTRLGKPGYHGGSSQKILEVDYPIGGVWVLYELYGVHVYTDKSVYSNLTVGVSLGFWPNRNYYRSIYIDAEGTTIHNGTESYLNFSDFIFTFFWGHSDPEGRARLDKGYALYLNIYMEFECPGYGDLKATFLLCPGVPPWICVNDVQVSSQLQDGVAIVLCGFFAGALCYIPAKLIKPEIIRRFALIRDRINRFLYPTGKSQ